MYLGRYLNCGPEHFVEVKISKNVVLLRVFEPMGKITPCLAILSQIFFHVAFLKNGVNLNIC
jgi:hypothetical protein